MPVNSLLLIGCVIAASTPTTVSSNVVMTKNAHGNEASGKKEKKSDVQLFLLNCSIFLFSIAALMNAALGNVLGTSFNFFLSLNCKYLSQFFFSSLLFSNG